MLMLVLCFLLYIITHIDMFCAEDMLFFSLLFCFRFSIQQRARKLTVCHVLLQTDAACSSSLQTVTLVGRFAFDSVGPVCYSRRLILVYFRPGRLCVFSA